MAADKTVLTTETITDATAAITNYKITCEGIFAKIQSEITNLCPVEFEGDASAGYQEFFAKITPALTTNLTGPESIISMLDSLMKAVGQMLDPVDTQLGSANRSAATEDSAAQ